MAGINKVILVGNIGRDPESRSMNGGGLVVNTSVATSYKTKDNQGGQAEVTEWHNVVFFNKVAEIALKYLKKGSKVYIEGSLKTDKWQTDAGETRYATKVIVKDMQMLGSKQDEQTQNNNASSYAKAKEGALPLESQEQTDDWENCPF